MKFLSKTSFFLLLISIIPLNAQNYETRQKNLEAQKISLKKEINQINSLITESRKKSKNLSNELEDLQLKISIRDKLIDLAIDKSELKEFLETLPDNLDTIIGEAGVKLSGGQRQRIGIARALYHNPPVIVLDEATSSLDNVTESSVMKSINALHGEKTLIIITHRLSTIKYCDYIYKLEKGKIIDQGTYDSVILDQK